MLSYRCIQDQQSVTGSMQATMVALTERMQRLEQQPCSHCRQVEASAADSIARLTSGLPASLHTCPLLLIVCLTVKLMHSRDTSGILSHLSMFLVTARQLLM